MNKAQFDPTDTHMSYYNNFLNPKDLAYMQEAKNLTGEIVMMTPEKYYQEAVKIFKGRHNEDDLIAQRSDTSLEQYMDDMRNGDVFPLCFLDYANSTQEGLHRMLAAALTFGWNIKYPVLVITPYDQELWDEQKQMEEVYDFMNYELRHAIEQASENLADWDEPVPDDIVDQMKAEIESIVKKEGYDIDVDCEIYNDDRIITYLNRYNNITLEEPICSTANAWLENMFNLEYSDEIDIDKEFEDLDIDDLEIADFFLKDS